MSAKTILGCIGAGRMGRGLAHALAYAGHTVHLLDAKHRSDDEFKLFQLETLNEIERSLLMVSKLGVFANEDVHRIVSRISVFQKAQSKNALSGCKIVFEGVPEILEAKKKALKIFDQYSDSQAILASTTSTILSTQLAQFTKFPQRFLNAHWLNPAYLMPLVEVSPTDLTEKSVVEKLVKFLESIGKVPVVCGASPGYIVPRIQALAMNEAARIVEEGIASAEDVDKAIKYGFGMRFAVLGMLEFIDWGGGDILYYASQYMSKAMDSDRFEAPKIVHTNMQEGKIGLKSGQGFYDYTGLDVDQYRLQRMSEFLKLLNHNNLMKEPVL